MYAINMWHLQRVQKDRKEWSVVLRRFFLKNGFRTYCSQQFCAKQGFQDGSVLKIEIQDIPVADKQLVSKKTCVGQGAVQTSFAEHTLIDAVVGLPLFMAVAARTVRDIATAFEKTLRQ